MDRSDVIEYETQRADLDRIDPEVTGAEIVQIGDKQKWIWAKEELEMESERKKYTVEQLRALPKEEIDSILRHDKNLEGAEEVWGTEWCTADAGLWVCMRCGHPDYGKKKPYQCMSEACGGRKGVWQQNPEILYKFQPIDMPRQDTLQNIYSELLEVMETYLSMSDKIYNEILALWCLGTWKFHKFRTYPFIFFKGEIGSGKTTALEVLGDLSYHSKTLVCPTPAVVSRYCNEADVAILLDEANTSFDRKTEKGNEMYSIFMSGYKKGQEYARAKQGQDEGVVERKVYTPKAYAATTTFEPALQSRSIEVFMTTEKPRGEVDNRAEDIFRDLRSRMLWWHFSKSEFSHPKTRLDGRVKEVWNPLCVMATQLGRNIEPLINYAQQDKIKMEEELKMSPKGRMVSVLISYVDDAIEMASMADVAGRYSDEMTPRRVGYILKSIDIERRRRKDARYVIFNEKTTDQLERLRRVYKL